MTAPREIPLDTGLYMETQEEDLVTDARRVRIYRTQVKQLEAMVEQYRQRFGELDDDVAEPESPEASGA